MLIQTRIFYCIQHFRRAQSCGWGWILGPRFNPTLKNKTSWLRPDGKRWLLSWWRYRLPSCDQTL